MYAKIQSLCHRPRHPGLSTRSCAESSLHVTARKRWDRVSAQQHQREVYDITAVRYRGVWASDMICASSDSDYLKSGPGLARAQLLTRHRRSHPSFALLPQNITTNAEPTYVPVALLSDALRLLLPVQLRFKHYCKRQVRIASRTRLAVDRPEQAALIATAVHQICIAV